MSLTIAETPGVSAALGVRLEPGRSRILMLKPQDNPPVRPACFGSVREIGGTWWVAHTKSRCEKAFAFDLMQRRLAHFLPLNEQITLSSGKRRRVMMPLFPSYVFFAGSAEDRLAAFETGRVCQILAVPDQPQFVDEIAAIDRALAAGACLTPGYLPPVGSRVCVVSGPFQGMSGQVLRTPSAIRLVLELTFLGRSAEMEIDPDCVEPLDAPAAVPAYAAPAYALSRSGVL
jgi:transcription antitermination factor NusG